MRNLRRYLVTLAALTLMVGLLACTEESTSPTEPEAPIGPAQGQTNTAGGAGPGVVGGTTIVIEKSTNGFDADDPPGPEIVVGDPVAWEYLVTNTGTETLVAVTVTDDQGVAVSCPTDTLAAGESMTCSAAGIAELGQYSNLGTANGTPDGGGDPVSDDDPSHYLGIEPPPAGPSIDIEKSTNGEDADDPPGPDIVVGDPVDWEYIVTNTGDVDLVNVVVTDDQGVTVSCPLDALAVGEVMTCTASGIAIAGQYANLGTASGEDAEATVVSDDDPSHYFGIEPLDCSSAEPSLDSLWPPNHKFQAVTVLGVVDGSGLPVPITIDSIFQDEPVNGDGDGNTSPDGMGVGTDVAELRAERAGGGNGRVYHVGFTADGAAGCSGEVLVGVPHDRHSTAIDDGALYDSTMP